MIGDFSTWISLLQGIGSAATAGALIFVYYQTVLTRRQVRMAQDEMDVNLRPWVCRDAGPTEPELNISANDKGELLLSFNTTNYGNTTPTSIKQFFMADYDIMDEEKIKSGFANEWQLTIFPSQHREFLCRLEPDRKEDFEDALKKRGKVFVGIILEYVFGHNKTGVYGVVFEVKKEQGGHSIKVQKEWAK